MSFVYCYLGLSQQCWACCYPLLSLLTELLWISQANLRLLSILHATNRKSQSLQATHLDRDSCTIFASSAFIRVWLLLEVLSEPMARTPHGFTVCCTFQERRTWGFYYRLCMNQHCQSRHAWWTTRLPLCQEAVNGATAWQRMVNEAIKNFLFFSLSCWVF